MLGPGPGMTSLGTIRSGRTMTPGGLPDKLRDEPPVDFGEFLGIETAGRFHLVHRSEVIAIAARDGPFEQPASAARGIRESVHRAARHENQRAGTDRLLAVADRQFVGPFQNV